VAGGLPYRFSILQSVLLSCARNRKRQTKRLADHNIIYSHRDHIIVYFMILRRRKKKKNNTFTAALYTPPDNSAAACLVVRRGDLQVADAGELRPCFVVL